MGSSGLIIDLGMNNQDAVAAINNLRNAFDGAFGKMRVKGAADTEALDQGILNAHHSTHLLLDEFGIHLPRAVIGAIAEMVPAIGGFGGAILAGFAIEEIPHAVEGIRHLMEGWEGFGEAEKKAMEKAIADTKTLHAEVISVEKELELFGKSQAEQAALRAKWAREDAVTAAANFTNAEKKLADFQHKAEGADKALSVYSLNTGEHYKGAIEAQTIEVNRAREAWKVADDKAILEQRRAQEAAAAGAKKDARETAKVVNKAAAESSRAWKQAWEDDDYVIKQLAEINKKDAETLALNDRGLKMLYQQGTEKTAQYAADAVAQMRTEKFLLNEITLNNEILNQDRQHNAEMARQAGGDQLAAATSGTVKLTGARKLQLTVTQALHQVEKDFSDALHGEMGGLESLTQSAAGIGEQFAQMIGGTKAAAEVKGLFDAALAIEYMAQFIGSWGTDVAALGASVQYGVASEAMFKAAGRGGGGGGASGGGVGGGSNSSYGGSGGRGGAGASNSGIPPQTLAPGASGSGGRYSSPGSGVIVVHGSQDLHQWVAGLVNGAVNRGITVTATSSLRGAPVGH